MLTNVYDEISKIHISLMTKTNRYFKKYDAKDQEATVYTKGNVAVVCHPGHQLTCQRHQRLVTLLNMKIFKNHYHQGLSDPYFEVKVGGVRKFKSEIVKKTLNPSWKALCHVGMPEDDNDHIDIVSVEVIWW